MQAIDALYENTQGQITRATLLRDGDRVITTYGDELMPTGAPEPILGWGARLDGMRQPYEGNMLGRWFVEQ